MIGSPSSNKVANPKPVTQALAELLQTEDLDIDEFKAVIGDYGIQQALVSASEDSIRSLILCCFAELSNREMESQ